MCGDAGSPSSIRISNPVRRRPGEPILMLTSGHYPFVTSSNTVAGAVATGTGIGPAAVGFVLGIVKAYTTRVGEGPFPCELFDDTARHIAEVGRERGTVTGRHRRCGWFDAVLVRKSCATSGVDGIALTKLDILDGLEQVRICTGYELDGRSLDVLRSRKMNRCASDRFTKRLKAGQRAQPAPGVGSICPLRRSSLSGE